MGKQTFQTSGKEQFSYFGFFLGQNIIYAIVYQYLGFFFTEGIGIDAIKVATMLAIPKVWDAINDPLMGVIVDKAHLKRGKFLPWIKFVVYALPLVTILLFIDMTASKQMMLILGYIFYTAWGMIYTVGDVPAFSIATVMTDKLPERDRLMSLGRLGAVVGVLAAAAFLSLKGMVGFTFTIIIYMAVAFVFMFPINFFAKERVPYARNKNISLKTIFSHLFKNKYLLIYYLAFFAATAANTLQFMAAYFAKSNLGDEGLTTVILAATVVPLLIAIPFLPAMIKAVGKRALTIWCSVGFIVLSVVQYFVGYESLILFLIFAAARVILMNIPLQMYGMFTADCVEYGAYKSGERTEGIAFAIQTFMTKLGGAVVQWVSLFIIGIAGYIEQIPIGQQQPDAALNAIWQVMTLVPIAGFAVMLIIMVFFYDLKESDVQSMVDEMSAKSQNN
ncbi:MAG: glycoside-pentoside-hexuronide (GPH):cation symporter [Eubacteriales bacterium]